MAQRIRGRASRSSCKNVTQAAGPLPVHFALPGATGTHGHRGREAALFPAKASPAEKSHCAWILAVRWRDESLERRRNALNSLSTSERERSRVVWLKIRCRERIEGSTPSSPTMLTSCGGSRFGDRHARLKKCASFLAPRPPHLFSMLWYFLTFRTESELSALSSWFAARVRTGRRSSVLSRAAGSRPFRIPG